MTHIKFGADIISMNIQMVLTVNPNIEVMIE